MESLFVDLKNAERIASNAKCKSTDGSTTNIIEASLNSAGKETNKETSEETTTETSLLIKSLKFSWDAFSSLL